MTIQVLDIAEPFFGLRHIQEEDSVSVGEPAILLNLSDSALRVEDQQLGSLQSAIVSNVALSGVARAILIEGVTRHDDEARLMASIRALWPLAFDVRGEARLRGVQHYMSPKTWVGQIGFSFYHAASVPLNVGLHRDHPFCPVPGFREVHTQIAGFGKMQQCRENDISTLYLEEPMAPGTTHRPMYDADGNYPWHQYETITPSVFMAVEILPEGAAR